MNFQQLKETQIYKDWVGNQNVAFNNVIYKEIEGVDNAFVVITKDFEDGKDVYTVYRFFKGGSKWYCSVDLQDVSAERVFEAIFEDYSEPLS